MAINGSGMGKFRVKYQKADEEVSLARLSPSLLFLSTHIF